MDQNKPADDKQPVEGKTKLDELPGNNGQFGTDNATEDYKPLKPEPPATGGRG